MATIKELLQTPDCVVRSNAFIENLLALDANTLNPSVEKIYEAWESRRTALEKAVRNLNLDGKEIDIDLNGVNGVSRLYSIVEVHAQTLSNELIRDFIGKMLNEAFNQKGTINDEFIPMLSTSREIGLVKESKDVAGNDLFTLHLFFTFD